MNEESNPDLKDLQFDKADVPDGGSESMSCTYCQGSLTTNYFELNGQPACEKCRYEVEQERTSGSSAGRVIRALFAGTAAAIAGALLYYGVSALTGYEFGLIAIVVGLMVGFAVKWGARGRGGWVYQGMAMLLTYLAIVGTYIPYIFDELENEEIAAEMEQQPEELAGETSEGEVPAEDTEEVVATPMGEDEFADVSFVEVVIGLMVLVLFIMALPFLAGFENIIGLVIIGIGLYEAWKINKYEPLVVEGPFQVGSRPSFSFESQDS